VKEKSRKRKKDSSKTSRPAKKAKQVTHYVVYNMSYTTLASSVVGLLTQETGRKKKAQKDPNAPKKPLSAYMLWLQENRPMIKKKYPGSTIGELGKRAGEMWNAMTDKTEWDEKAKKARKNYEQVMAEYKASGKAPTASPAKPSKRSAAKGGSKAKPASKPSTTSSPSSKKYTSAEYIDSEEDSSAEEDGHKETERAPARKGKTRGGGGKGLVSLPSGDEEGESEGEAESTGSDDSEASD
jgi:structure-specific recognition protein 1